MQVRACVRMHQTSVRMRMYAYARLGFLDLYFPKIDLFAHKMVLFSIKTFLTSILNLIGPHRHLILHL